MDIRSLFEIRQSEMIGIWYYFCISKLRLMKSFMQFEEFRSELKSLFVAIYFLSYGIVVSYNSKKQIKN